MLDISQKFYPNICNGKTTSSGRLRKGARQCRGQIFRNRAHLCSIPLEEIGREIGFLDLNYLFQFAVHS